MRMDRFVETVFVSTSSVTAVTPSPLGKAWLNRFLTYIHIVLLTPFSAFSFDATGTKEKAWQKENADKGDFAPAVATKAPPLESANF